VSRGRTALLALLWLALALYVLLRLALSLGRGVDVVLAAWFGGVVSVYAARRVREWARHR